MPKIIRFEFMGSWIYFWLLCMTVFAIPIAILYLMSGTLCIVQGSDDPGRSRRGWDGRWGIFRRPVLRGMRRCGGCWRERKD